MGQIKKRKKLGDERPCQLVKVELINGKEKPHQPSPLPMLLDHFSPIFLITFPSAIPRPPSRIPALTSPPLPPSSGERKKGRRAKRLIQTTRKRGGKANFPILGPLFPLLSFFPSLFPFPTKPRYFCKMSFPPPGIQVVVYQVEN